MVKNFLSFLFFIFLTVSSFAHPCDEYKRDIDINIKKSEWKTIIQESDKDLWPTGGFISIQPFHMINPKTSWVFKGNYFCVFLESVDVEIGFQDFIITIDKKYKKDSCEYNAVLEHENHHKSDAIDAFNNVFGDIDSVLKEIVKSVEPISVESPDDVPVATEKIRNKISKNKKLIDLTEKFKEQNDKATKDLDSKSDEKFHKCIEDKVNAAFDKFYKNKKDEK